MNRSGFCMRDNTRNRLTEFDGFPDCLSGYRSALARAKFTVFRYGHQFNHVDKNIENSL